MSIIKGNVNWANQEGIVKPDGLPSRGEAIDEVQLLESISYLHDKTKLLKQDVDNAYARASVSQLSTVVVLINSINSILIGMKKEIKYNLLELNPTPNE
jgi:hypothetical protein